jgi:hypothetical protein
MDYAQAVISSMLRNLSTRWSEATKLNIEDRICIFCHTSHNSSPSIAS